MISSTDYARAATVDDVQKRWLPAHRFLIARRLSQFAVLAVFLSGPWFGIWIASGNLNSSLTFGILPLTDPFVLLQSWFAGHALAGTAILGAAIVTGFYFLVGGRAYCAWVCPVNVITDGAAWLRRRLGLPMTTRLSRTMRYWLIAASLIGAAVSGAVIWELVNPVSILHRGVIFGLGAGIWLIAAVFLFDLFVAPRGWCGHLCPVGAFYSVIGTKSLLRVNAAGRSRCNDCADCYRVCPEPQVIKPALKPQDPHATSVILSPNCTNCGRCVDVCAKQVFKFGARYTEVQPPGNLT